MQPGLDMTTRQSWQQVSIQFHEYTAAETVGVTHLWPMMAQAGAAGLVTSWSFIRKSPCWRLRYLPSRNTPQDARQLIHKILDDLREVGHLSRWVETIYEPEIHAFGGADGLDIAHELFHQDSKRILGQLTHESTSSDSDKRREISILLCTTLMRGAGQDWYEQGDIWGRVAENRPLSADMQGEQLNRLVPQLRRLMTVDTSPLLQHDGALSHLADWATAFQTGGARLGTLGQNGHLTRGVRAVLTHHVIFHWNRLGLPYETQSALAHAAKAAVLSPDATGGTALPG